MRTPSFHQGDDVKINVTVYADDAKTTLKDLTGATVTGRFGLKSLATTLKEVVGSVIDGSGGKARVALSSADSAALAAADYDFQTEVVDSGGQKNVVLDTPIKVKTALPDLP